MLAKAVARYMNDISVSEGTVEWDEVDRTTWGNELFWTKQILLSWEAEGRAVKGGGKLRMSNEGADRGENDTAMPRGLMIKFLPVKKMIRTQVYIVE